MEFIECIKYQTTDYIYFYQDLQNESRSRDKTNATEHLTTK